MLLFAGALFAARSQEPVVITTCRSFEARSDDQSKTALAGGPSMHMHIVIMLSDNRNRTGQRPGTVPDREHQNGVASRLHCSCRVRPLEHGKPCHILCAFTDVFVEDLEPVQFCRPVASDRAKVGIPLLCHFFCCSCSVFIWDSFITGPRDIISALFQRLRMADSFLIVAAVLPFTPRRHCEI